VDRDQDRDVDDEAESERKLRTAVVVVHGMGEHRPLETLNGFIDAGLPAVGGTRRFYSRPDGVTESYESRRYLAPRQPEHGVDPELYAQTEFFEYHWAYLMQGNELGDLWSTVRKFLLLRVGYVPAGLRVIWVLAWLLIAAGIWAFIWGPLSNLDLAEGTIFEVALEVLLGGGIAAFVVGWLVTGPLKRWITSSFVDVVRYLDTSPRSYSVRRDIREGIIKLLDGLMMSDRYDRVVIVAHSLGSYIAYDAISYLWGQYNTRYAHPPAQTAGDGQSPAGLPELEKAASNLLAKVGTQDEDQFRDRFRAAQRDLWVGLRLDGNPWLITDLITFGSPMYFADRLYTRDHAEFTQRVERWELPTCPPEDEGAEYNNINKTTRWFSWKHESGRRMLYHGAPFAVTRWTNMWFPAHAGFFGDWFGGPLAPLYGPGITDIPLKGNRPQSRWPAIAHAKYFSFPEDTNDDSVTKLLRRALDLASTDWLADTLVAPRPSESDPDKVDQAAGQDEHAEFVLGGLRIDLGPVDELMRQGRGVEDLIAKLPHAAARQLEALKNIFGKRD
jgi:hypothetical protein